MRSYLKPLGAAGLLGTLALLAACSSEYFNVPTNYIGMILTPTGYEQRIYSAGQVNLGAEQVSGLGNRLVLIQRSGLHVKEQFIGAAASQDREDHRVLTSDGKPATLDVRILLALPNYQTDDGAKDLRRIFLLGNPRRSKQGPRVLVIDAKSIYQEQARLQVRGKIRQMIAGFANFNDVFSAFAKPGAESLSDKIKLAVVKVLKDENVPLRVIGVEVSNLKPDAAVISAQTALQATEIRIQAIKKMGTFLRQNPDMAQVYKYQMLQELFAIAGKSGTHTMLLSDLQSTPQMTPEMLAVLKELQKKTGSGAGAGAAE